MMNNFTEYNTVSPFIANIDNTQFNDVKFINCNINGVKLMIKNLPEHIVNYTYTVESIYLNINIENVTHADLESLLENAYFTDVSEYIDCLSDLNKKFKLSLKNYEKNIIVELLKISSGTMKIWELLSSKPDKLYNDFVNRIFPDGILNNEEWNKIATKVAADKYPEKLLDSAKKVKANKTTEEVKSNNTNTETVSLDVNIITSNTPPIPSETYITNYNMVLPLSSDTNLDKYFAIIDKLKENKMEPIGYMFCLMLFLNFDTCHVIKDSRTWLLLEPEKYKLINTIINCLTYALYLLKYEDTMIKEPTLECRQIFTLEQASTLPKHNTSYEKCPYNILYEPKELTSPFYLVGNIRKINNFDVFKRRFELITRGVFNGINLKELNMVVTGSTLIPCAGVSPLEDLTVGTSTREFIYDDEFYKNLNSKEKEFVNYTEFYYPSNKSYVMADYVKFVENSKDDISELFMNFNDEELQANINSIIKKFYIKKYEMFPSSNRNNDEFDENTHSDSELLFDEKKSAEPPVEETEKTEETEKLPKEHNPSISDIDIAVEATDIYDYCIKCIKLFKQIKQNRSKIGKVYMLITNNNYSYFKFRIQGPGMLRPIELFRVSNSLVSIKSFHLPVVRMFYNGENVYLYRACVNALMSGVNEGYNWFASNKCPVDTVFKYIQRGYTLLCNKLEQKCINAYIGKLLNKTDEELKELSIYMKTDFNNPIFSSNCNIRNGLTKLSINNSQNNKVFIPYINISNPYRVYTGLPSINPPNYELLYNQIFIDLRSKYKYPQYNEIHYMLFNVTENEITETPDN